MCYNPLPPPVAQEIVHDWLFDLVQDKSGSYIEFITKFVDDRFFVFHEFILDNLLDFMNKFNK